jgi:hypothetical protein
MGDPILAQLLEYILMAQRGRGAQRKPWEERFPEEPQEGSQPDGSPPNLESPPWWWDNLGYGPGGTDEGWVDVPLDEVAAVQPQPMPPSNGPQWGTGPGMKVWEDGSVSFAPLFGGEKDPTKEEYFRERWEEDAPKRTDKRSSPKGTNVVNPDLLAMLMEYILNRQTNGDASIGGAMPYDENGLRGTIGGLGAAMPPSVDMGGDNTLSAISAGNPAQHDTSPSTYGGPFPPPRLDSDLGKLIAALMPAQNRAPFGAYNRANAGTPGKPYPEHAEPQPRPVAGPAGNVEPKESNRANTPPRTGVLPNGNPFPGQAQPRNRSVKTLPANPVTARNQPRPVSNPPASRPTPPRTPVNPPRGISYPIQAAKRIQQAAVQPQARPQIAKPMSPGTLRSLTRR